MRAEQVFTGQGQGVEEIGGAAEDIGAQHDPWVTAEHAQRDSSYPLRRGGRYEDRTWGLVLLETDGTEV
jgi:hypothetical protein